LPVRGCSIDKRKFSRRPRSNLKVEAIEKMGKRTQFDLSQCAHLHALRDLFIETVTGDPTMSEFRVSFYKTLKNASGHISKDLQGQLDLTSDVLLGR
jgi:translation initiation factor 2 beta subunit (eIF-2beta)/eIF-5